MRRRLLVIVVCMFWIFCGLLNFPAYSQEKLIEGRSYALPCEPHSIAVASDGTTAWLVCEETGKGALESGWVHKNRTYSLNGVTGRILKISEGHGVVRFMPSPKGSQPIMRRWGEKHGKRALLVNGHRVVKELPVLSPIDWSPDGTKIYFEAGSTVEADAWDILGILRLKDLSIAKVKLLSPTEGFGICAATGEIFTGAPILGEAAPTAFDAVVYDANGVVARRETRFPPGRFSANCRYVATDDFFHGPVPWAIVEVASGKRLAWFQVGDAADAAWQGFVAWNPQKESVYLRTTDTPVKGSSTATVTALQVVDAAGDRIIREFSDFQGSAAWSAEGESVILAEGKHLQVVPLKWN